MNSEASKDTTLIPEELQQKEQSNTKINAQAAVSWDIGVIAVIAVIATL